MKSEMQILWFYLVGQSYLSYHQPVLTLCYLGKTMNLANIFLRKKMVFFTASRMMYRLLEYIMNQFSVFFLWHRISWVNSPIFQDTLCTHQHFYDLGHSTLLHLLRHRYYAGLCCSYEVIVLYPAVVAKLFCWGSRLGVVTVQSL